MGARDSLRCLLCFCHSLTFEWHVCVLLVVAHISVEEFSEIGSTDLSSWPAFVEFLSNNSPIGSPPTPKKALGRWGSVTNRKMAEVGGGVYDHSL